MEYSWSTSTPGHPFTRPSNHLVYQHGKATPCSINNYYMAFRDNTVNAVIANLKSRWHLMNECLTTLQHPKKDPSSRYMNVSHMYS